MLKQKEISDIAKSRLAEAQILHDNQKYDGAVYLCGYAVELSLKALVLRDKLWGFPEDSEEFRLYSDVRTHDLDKLLKTAGGAHLLNDRSFQTSWGHITGWSSEFRYRPVGSFSLADSSRMISSARDIMETLGIK